MLPDGWNLKRLEDIASVERGKFSARPRNDPRYYGGTIPFVQTGDISRSDGKLYSYTQTLNEEGLKVSRLFPENTILITIAANIGDTAITTFPVACPDSLVAIQPKNGTDVVWLQSNLQTRKSDLESAATQNAQKNINLETLRPLNILCPPENEQRIISNVLSTWSSAIENIAALIIEKQKQKKALMQRLLTGKQRLPEFKKHEWQEVDLGSIFKEVKTKVGDKKVMPHSITAGTGFVSHNEKWGKDISGRQYENYTLLKKGQFSYNKGNSKKYECGCMYLLKDKNEIAVPNVFISFERRNDNVCNEFYAHYFIADFCALELKKHITSGARSNGLLNLSKTDFFSIKMPLPSFQEQQKIAAVLNAADKEIDLLTQKLEAYQEQKKGLMQQLLTGKKRVKLDRKKAA